MLRAADTAVRDGRSTAYVVWDAASGKEVHTFLAGARTNPPRPVWSPDGKRLLFPVEHGLGVWDAATWRVVTVLKGSGALAGGDEWNPGGRSQWSTDGTRILTSDGAAVTVWEPNTGAELARLAIPNTALTSAEWQPGGVRIITHSEEFIDARPVKVGMQLGPGHGVLHEPPPERIQVTRVWDAASGALIRAFRGSHGSWSPDGKQLRLPRTEYAVAVIDAATGTRLTELVGHRSRVVWAALSPDGKRVVTCAEAPERLARVWDAETGVRVAVLEGHAGSVRSATWTRDGRRVVTTSEDHTSRVWDAATGRQLAQTLQVEGERRYAGPVAPSPDGDRILGAPWDAVEVWDLRPARPELRPPGHAGPLLRDGIAWTRDRTGLVTAGADGTVRMWDAATGRELSVLGRHAGPVMALAFGPTGREFVTASADGTARVWDARTGRHLGLLEGHRGAITSAAFSPDGGRIVTTSADGTARVWAVPPGDLHPQPPLAVLDNPLPPRPSWRRNEITSASWSPDGSKLVLAGRHGPVRVWNTRIWRPVAIISPDGAQGVSWSPRGDRILLASRDQSYQAVRYSLRDAETGEQVWPPDPSVNWEGGAAVWSPEGRHVLVSGDGATLRDARTGTVASSFLLEGRGIRWEGLGIDPDGRTEAYFSKFTKTGRTEWSERFADEQTARRVLFERGDESTERRQHFAAFGPDGKKLLTGADDGCRIWDVQTGKQSRVLWESGTAAFTGAAWSPDGARVATAHADGSARVWDAATGEVLTTTPLSRTGGVTGAVWHPTGRWVLLSGFGPEAAVWDTTNQTRVPPAVPLRGKLDPAAIWPDGSKILAAPTRWYQRPLSTEGTSWQIPPEGQDQVLATTADGSRELLGGRSCVVRDAAAKEVAATLKGHEGVVLTASFSPDGSRVVTAGEDGTVRVWHVATGAELLVLKGEADGLADSRFRLVSWSPDGHRILVATPGGDARLLDGMPGPR